MSEREVAPRDKARAARSDGRRQQGDNTGQQRSPAGLLDLQRLAGNRAVGTLLGGRPRGGGRAAAPAAGRPRGAEQPGPAGPSFLSAHDWAHQSQGATRGGRLPLQRDGNPVAESVNKTRHDIGRAQNRAVVLGTNLAPGDAAKYKMAIKELQRRLIAALGGRLKSGIWKRDGVFGSSTESALKKYQRLRGLDPSGEADLDTWRSLEGEAVGSARGREEFHWKETMTELGGGGTDLTPEATAAFDWSKKEDAFDVNVALEFTGATAQSKKVIGDIKKYWNVFALQYKGAKGGAAKRKPKNPRVDLRFNIGSADAKPGAPKVTNDVSVFLFTPPHPQWAARGLPDINDKKSRSDMLNWNVTEPSLAEMASHEFGHVIGLEDEYSRPHDAMKRVAGAVKAHSAKPTGDAAKSLENKLAAVKTAADFEAIHTDIVDLAKTPGRVAAVAQVFRERTGQRLEVAWKTAAKTQHTAAKNRADALDLDVTAAAQAAGLADVAAGQAMAARNVVATAKSAGFLGGADLVTKAAFDNVVPAVKKVRIQAAEAKTHALAAKTAAGQASYAQAGDDFAKSQTADAQAATSAKSAADAAKLAQDGLAEVAAAVVDATRLAGEALDKADKSHTESTKTADRREARALRREGSAKEAQEQHESARRAWQLRARMGVGHVSGSNQLQQLAGASQTSGLAAKQARQAADDAKDAANKAEDLAKKSRESGASLGDMGQAFEAEGKAGSATADAWSATGGKASQAASEHTESVVMWAWYTTTKGTFEDADRTGYTAPGIMGTHYEDIKTGLARENSPALEHEHPLQPRHVARFAEYIMKYKPGDLWEPVLK